ncbi:hypothetical protein BGZ97_009398 [Linnemannia gamsii]|uniref:Uncharacterized protein n=1 Tax=Linnemannia gamsii TaxID=64522 RepID=A0A9P6QL36_9FUNG|nr:hypothetical protein BGZ97_009398 [Linnemannia gamsii]
MTRTFSIMAIVAMLATTLCLSTTTSAVPVSGLEGRAVPSPAECIQQKWETIKPLVQPFVDNAATKEQKEKAGKLLENGQLIEKPTAAQIQEALNKFTDQEQTQFLQFVGCKA